MSEVGVELLFAKYIYMNIYIVVNILFMLLVLIYKIVNTLNW